MILNFRFDCCGVIDKSSDDRWRRYMSVVLALHYLLSL